MGGCGICWAFRTPVPPRTVAVRISHAHTAHGKYQCTNRVGMFRRRSREDARVRFKRGVGPRELGDGRQCSWLSLMVVDGRYAMRVDDRCPPGPGPSGWRVRATACHGEPLRPSCCRHWPGRRSEVSDAYR